VSGGSTGDYGAEVTSYAEVEDFVLTLPETTSSPSYGGAPALRVNKKMFARLRGRWQRTSTT
jgi:hypothetical protein